MTKARLLAEVSSLELAEWRAYDELEPIGDWRADFRTALLASLLYNANRDPKAEALSIDDFMPVFDPVTRQRKKDSEMMAKLLNVKPKTVE